MHLFMGSDEGRSNSDFFLEQVSGCLFQTQKFFKPAGVQNVDEKKLITQLG
jgi:hypothetical protein